jgi:WD40 repeat protein
LPLSTTAADSGISLIDLTTGQKQLLRGHDGSVRALCFSPDGTLLAAAVNPKVIYVWSVASGDVVASLLGHESQPNCVTFSADGREVASGDDLGIVRIWNLPVRHETFVLNAHSEPVRSIAFSPDGQTLVTSSRDQNGKGEVRIWSARDTVE